MLLPPACEKTTQPRVVAAITFAFVFPPVALAILLGVAANPTTSLEQVSVVLADIPTAVMTSLPASWIFVLPACIAWAFLHQFDRHYRWSPS